jgi:hypothetical protein
MAPVSVTPGRLRLEGRELIGKKHSCSLLAIKINAITGVIRSDINPRTGRILIIFNTSNIESKVLIEQIGNILDEIKGEIDSSHVIETYHGSPCSRCANNQGNEKITRVAIRAAVDIASHFLLPKPLRVLGPIVANAIMKS